LSVTRFTSGCSSSFSLSLLSFSQRISLTFIGALPCSNLHQARGNPSFFALGWKLRSDYQPRE
jgi:hypothetical protein